MIFAIYSRKSKYTGKGESIGNQIELCKAYVRKNFDNVTEQDFFLYEDEGFSGKNLERPQFKELLKDAAAHRFGCIVCYRLDRISRSVVDFSSLVELFSKLEISFICIREQFDTSTPMGRAMMYIASVFAQLERETIAERVRDNMLLLAREGRWLGGTSPFGFRSKQCETMILDGKLLSGKSGFSGEIGHFPLLNNNQYCRCGKIGCLETGASGSALHRLMLEKLKEGRPSLLSEKYQSGKPLTLEDILDAIQREDVAAIECIEAIGTTLGRAVAGLINLFNPDMVVIGGRLSVTEHYLMPPMRSAVNKFSLNLVNNDTVIKVSKLGREAGAIGASLLSKARLLNSMA